MENIFKAIQNIAIKIDKAIKKEDLYHSDSENTFGEQQLKLDLISDKIIEKEFSSLKNIKQLVSEEKEDILILNEKADLTICYDPLDGSSLIDVNLSVGSIFGIYKGELKGENLISSAYIVYGPRIELVFCTKKIAPTLYRFINNSFKKIKEIKLNKKGKINATGGFQKNWENKHKNFIFSLFNSGYSLRYSGGMVPDLHHILLKQGGIFSYPATKDKPKGKLRQLFEIIPFAFIYEKAGGYAVDEKGNSLLKLNPKNIHDISPCFFGSEMEILEFKKYYK